MKIRIDWEPVGIRSKADSTQNLLSAARRAGVQLAAICGGNGTCGACRIIICSGQCSPITKVETDLFTEAEVNSGMRLACQTFPCSDLKINLPPGSMSSSQRLQIEGSSIADETDDSTVLQEVELELDEPVMQDLRSDSKRVRDALLDKGFPEIRTSLGLIHSLSDELRQCGWRVTGLLHANELIGILRRDQAVYGLAVDIGTTKIAAYLVDMHARKCIARSGAMNPQISYGEDVVSRIAYTQGDPEGRNILQRLLIVSINKLIDELCDQAACKAAQIMDAVVVCNTAIHHFFVNLPVSQLGLYPFVPAVSEALNLPAKSSGLKIANGASVYLPRNIAGYVGADHVSMLIGSRAWQPGKNRVALDIGTNTEISLITKDGRMYCCSCASGPAFEGAHIHNGMRAASGAIERAQIHAGKMQYRTIDDQPASGICGSGILDLVATLKQAGVIDRNGKFDPEYPGVRKATRNYEFVVVPEDENLSGQAITVTRADINEIVLAKSAIRTGMEILLIEAGLTDMDIEEFVVAGAFGTYLDIGSAVEIGMFPDIPLERFIQVGNAAGTGAQKMLLSSTERERSEAMVDNIHYVELTVHPSFKNVLLRSMSLERGTVGRR